MNYKTILNEVTESFTEKKSEFIAHLAPVETEEEALSFVEKIRSQNRKATHNCYAYLIRENNISRHSDDGEPGGTAGVPIYEVLRKEQLTDIACVVTRYFGGILLGAGGLVRAYRKAASMAVSSAKIKEMASAVQLEIKLNYTFYGKIAAAFAKFDAKTENEDFSDIVKITAVIKLEYFEEFKADLIELCFGNVSVELVQKLTYDFG